MNSAKYLKESEKTDSHGNYNFSQETKTRLINALRRYLTTMKELDEIKREIFYVNNTPRNQVRTPRGYTHGILGVVTESQELAETFLDHLENGTPLDKINLREESGDVLWYIACILREGGTDFEKAMAGNIAKLQARFPEKFEETKALGERDKTAELEAMQAAERSENSSSMASGRGEIE